MASVLEPLAIGSVTDIATLVVVLWAIRGRIEPELQDLGAAIVAIARERPTIDDEQIQKDLGVDDRDVDPYRESD